MPKRPPTFKSAHALVQKKTSRKQSDQERRDLAHRKLLRSQAWRELSEAIRQQRPVCERCGVKGSEVVHHKRKLADHPEDWLNGDMCESLCKQCHDRATAKGE